MVFFVKFIYAILPSSFLFGLLRSYYTSDNKKFSNIYLIGFISLLIGSITQRFFMEATYDSEFINVIGGVLIALFLIFLFTFLLKKLNIFFYVFCSILFLYSGGLITYFVHDLPITGTVVINSSLIIHLAFIALAIAISYFFYLAIYTFSKSYSKGIIYNTILIASMLLYGIIALGEILSYLIKNDLIAVTSTRISIIAKITYYSYLNIYIYTLFLFVFALIYFLNRTNVDLTLDKKSKIRKLKKQRVIQNRWLLNSIIAVVILCPTLLFYDLVASQPPTRSKAIIVNANKDGKVMLNIKDFLDGDLHRFAYITEDGHKVRFFAINRYKDKEKVTVVFDACMICGDLGYIKEDNQVICIACSVRVFVPSIGQPGGCNPIPFEFKKENGKIIIDSKTLESGAKYFSEVVEREVTDIISGAKLLNTKAKYSYEYLGKTFYFENEANLEKFRDDPTKYAKDTVKRRWRVEGHKEQK